MKDSYLAAKAKADAQARQIADLVLHGHPVPPRAIDDYAEADMAAREAEFAEKSAFGVSA